MRPRVERLPGSQAHFDVFDLRYRRIQYRRLVNGNTPKASGRTSPDPANTADADADPTLPLESGDETPNVVGTAEPDSDGNKMESRAASAPSIPAVIDEPYCTAPAFLTDVGFVDDKTSGVPNWTAEQYQSFRLTDGRRKRLEEVGFCWSAREGNEKATLLEAPISRNSYDDQWDAMFAQLEQYKQIKGHCLVPKRHPENQKLGTVSLVFVWTVKFTCLGDPRTQHCWFHFQIIIASGLIHNVSSIRRCSRRLPKYNMKSSSNGMTMPVLDQHRRQLRRLLVD